MRPTGPRLLLLAILLVASAFFFTGITWGLPTRASDRFLFGDRTPWTGAQILALAGGWDESAGRGSDIAMHPLAGRDHAIVVNATDADRAAIVRRFRLYSCQPDEMITFRALSRMHPDRLDLDPQFFQYGGLWVYPVGLLLKVAALLHLVTLRSDLSFYLDHPEAFGRFYVIARCYSAAWGLVGVVVVWQIARTWTGRTTAAVMAGLLFATMPVVVNAGHEAKPHLAGSVLTLLTVLLAMRYVQGGRTRTALLAGVAAGASFGMILTGVYALAVLPVMVLLRPAPLQRRAAVLVMAVGCGAIVFFATNPYLPVDYLFLRSIVQSNVGNYGTFYKPELSGEGVLQAVSLLSVGVSPMLAVVGVIAAVVCGVSRRSPWTWLFAFPVLLVAVQFVLLARGKPAEYARFSLLIGATMAVGIGVWLGGSSGRLGMAVASVVTLASMAAGGCYLRSFLLDGSADSTRAQASVRIDRRCLPGSILAIGAEPAPYCLPPVDLFRWRIFLCPPGASMRAAVPGATLTVQPVDWPAPCAPESPLHQVLRLLQLDGTTPISWANKPLQVQSAATSDGLE